MNSIGIIGMAVMGQNLALNIADHDYSVAVYNRTPEKTTKFAQERKHKNITPFYNISDFVSSLSSPRIILLMIKAGNPVDNQINQLSELLDSGDILIDGGNSNYKDSQRRTYDLKLKNIEFVGAGISGGEDGARYGPSIMPGGSKTAWEKVKDILIAVSAKANDGAPCCAWLGPDGAGHFVKTVHNGIEYGDMQLISEIYHVMRDALKMQQTDIADIFAKWNKGKLNSFLIEISCQILRKEDDLADGMLLSKVLDVAKQKGTGRWTVDSALDLGEPISLISQAVFQRILSSQSHLRESSARYFGSKVTRTEIQEIGIIDKLENALYLSKVISYVQGFQLLRAGSELHNWDLSLKTIAAIWRNGCIIRSVFLDQITQAYEDDPKIESFMFSKYFRESIKNSTEDLRTITSLAIKLQIPVPGLSAAISYFDSITAISLPTNLIQAQRDYFGAHGYRRIDTGEETHHSDWK